MRSRDAIPLWDNKRSRHRVAYAELQTGASAPALTTGVVVFPDHYCAQPRPRLSLKYCPRDSARRVESRGIRAAAVSTKRYIPVRDGEERRAGALR